MSVSNSDLEGAVSSLFPQPEMITDEAIQRACVNRKYYITYHCLLSIIGEHFPNYDMSNEGMFGNTGSHNRVYLVFDDIYKYTNCKNAQRLSIKFTNFLSKRHKADYNLNEDFSEFDYKQALKFAIDIPELAGKIAEVQKQKAV